MTTDPLVTVLIPARNEATHIERCLRAVLEQDHRHDRMEIVVVDGGSTDGTAGVVRGVLGDCDVDWKLVENAVGTTPSNLNAGLVVASGDVICRVDARSIVPEHYVRHCANVLTRRPGVAVVGGAQVAVARDRRRVSRGIARALNNRYAMGGSRYRAGATSGPSDTVYLGVFRAEDLRAAGGWDEYFETNQDFELNRRMGRHGLVWFDDRLEVGYIPRASLPELWHQYHRFGRWKVRYWRRTRDRPRPRQVVLLGVSATAAMVMPIAALSYRGRVRRAAVLAGGAMVGGLAVDALGSDHRPADIATRFVAVAVMGITSSGWVSGVWVQYLRGDGT